MKKPIHINHSGSNNDVLHIDSGTVNGIIYDDESNFSCSGSNADYVVTVLDDSTEITAFDLEFTNSDAEDAVFEFDSPATRQPMPAAKQASRAKLKSCPRPAASPPRP
jgi:hypothetical protein